MTFAETLPYLLLGLAVYAVLAGLIHVLDRLE